MADEWYWTYKASTPTPKFEDVPKDAFNGTKEEWEKFTPGMRREIVRYANALKKKETTNEKVTFRLIQTPCCGQLLCWVNPRFPSHCPECGKFIYPEVKGCVLQFDAEAWLKIHV